MQTKQRQKFCFHELHHLVFFQSDQILMSSEQAVSVFVLFSINRRSSSHLPSSCIILIVPQFLNNAVRCCDVATGTDIFFLSF